MSLTRLQDRLADLSEKQKRLREKIVTCKVRTAALKTARVDAFTEGTGTGAIDAEIKGIKADADDCKEAIGAISQAIVKIEAQIVDEQNRVIALKTAETGQHALYIRSYGILYGNKSYKQKIIALKELFHQNVPHSLAKASD